MRYEYLLVDLDDTLLDYRLSERLSLIATLAELGVEASEVACRLYSAINVELWRLREQGIIDRLQLRHERFARLLPAVGLPITLADEANAIYSRQLRNRGDLLPGAMELLRAARGRMEVAAVTNGVSDVQRSRLSNTPILPLLDAVIISEEVGLKKPDPAIIYCALKALGCSDPARSVMLGDSLTADIAAAKAAGIDSIWLTPVPEPGHGATFCAADLMQTMELLGLKEPGE